MKEARERSRNRCLEMVSRGFAISQIMELIVLEVEKQRPDMVGCILSTPFHLDDEVVFLSTSIGITFYPNNAKDIETLVKNADQAMYVAKSKGRNRF